MEIGRTCEEKFNSIVGIFLEINRVLLTVKMLLFIFKIQHLLMLALEFEFATLLLSCRMLLLSQLLLFFEIFNLHTCCCLPHFIFSLLFYHFRLQIFRVFTFRSSVYVPAFLACCRFTWNCTAQQRIRNFRSEKFLFLYFSLFCDVKVDDLT